MFKKWMLYKNAYSFGTTVAKRETAKNREEPCRRISSLQCNPHSDVQQRQGWGSKESHGSEAAAGCSPYQITPHNELPGAFMAAGGGIKRDLSAQPRVNCLRECRGTQTANRGFTDRIVWLFNLSFTECIFRLWDNDKGCQSGQHVQPAACREQHAMWMMRMMDSRIILSLSKRKSPPKCTCGNPVGSSSPPVKPFLLLYLNDCVRDTGCHQLN